MRLKWSAGSECERSDAFKDQLASLSPSAPTSPPCVPPPLRPHPLAPPPNLLPSQLSLRVPLPSCSVTERKSRRHTPNRIGGTRDKHSWLCALLLLCLGLLPFVPSPAHIGRSRHGCPAASKRVRCPVRCRRRCCLCEVCCLRCRMPKAAALAPCFRCCCCSCLCFCYQHVPQDCSPMQQNSMEALCFVLTYLLDACPATET